MTPFSKDSLNEQPAIALFSQLGWYTTNFYEESRPASKVGLSLHRAYFASVDGDFPSETQHTSDKY